MGEGVAVLARNGSAHLPRQAEIAGRHQEFGVSTRQAGVPEPQSEDILELKSPDDDRRYPKRPLVGVGALIFRRDRILMAQRGKEPLKGWWSLRSEERRVGKECR